MMWQYEAKEYLPFAGKVLRDDTLPLAAAEMPTLVPATSAKVVTLKNA